MFEPTELLIGFGKKRTLTQTRRKRRSTKSAKPGINRRQKRTVRLPLQTKVKTSKKPPTKKPSLPKVIYIKKPDFTNRSTLKDRASLNRNSIWQGVQIPVPYPVYQPVTIPFNPNSMSHISPSPSNIQNEEIWYDAPQWPENRRPTDGEADTDAGYKHRMNIDDVLDFMVSLPGRIRKIILTSLFGTAVGMIIDLLLGSPLGLTSRVIRAILRLIPGGWLILAGFDGLGFLIGRGKEILSLPNDPKFAALAEKIQSGIPPDTAEKIAQIADHQIGGHTFATSLAALLHAVFLNNST